MPRSPLDLGRHGAKSPHEPWKRRISAKDSFASIQAVGIPLPDPYRAHADCPEVDTAQSAIIDTSRSRESVAMSCSIMKLTIM